MKRAFRVNASALRIDTFQADGSVASPTVRRWTRSDCLCSLAFVFLATRSNGLRMQGTNICTVAKSSTACDSMNCWRTSANFDATRLSAPNFVTTAWTWPSMDELPRSRKVASGNVPLKFSQRCPIVPCFYAAGFGLLVEIKKQLHVLLRWAFEVRRGRH